jgi:hypothetical protein
MKMLSIQQPWANVIVYHGKNVENRARNLTMRGYFAIHASMLPRIKDFKYLERYHKIILDPKDVQLGAIIGVAELIDVLNPGENSKEFKKWRQRENFGYVLSNIIPLKKAIPCKGGRGIWPMTKKVENLVMKQLSPVQKKMVMANLMGN